MTPVVTRFLKGTPVRPSYRMVLPSLSLPAFSIQPQISSSVAPSKTGVLVTMPLRSFLTEAMNSSSSILSTSSLMAGESKTSLTSSRTTCRAAPESSSSASWRPSSLAPQPRWVSMIWPMFIREGTPRG